MDPNKTGKASFPRNAYFLYKLCNPKKSAAKSPK